MLDLKERPDHPFVLFNLGMTCHYNGEQEKAIAWLEKSIAAADPADSHVRKAFALLGNSLEKLDRWDDALAAYLKGLDVVKVDAELEFHCGRALTQLGNLVDAKQHYLRVRNDDLRSHFSSVDTAILGWKLNYNLASVCFRLHEYDEGKAYAQEALSEAPTELPAAFDLFDNALSVGDTHTAALMLNHVRSIEGNSSNLLAMSNRMEATARGNARNTMES